MVTVSEFLRQVRRELNVLLTKLPTQEIHNPDPLFKQFYTSGDNSVEHYIALFAILRDAGFNRIDIASSVMDSVPIGKKLDADSENSPRVVDTTGCSETVRVYLVLTTSALNVVYNSSEM